jgi:DUF1680 family protein
MRLVASFQHYLASWDAKGIQIHQFANAVLEHRTEDGVINLTITTEYPWSGHVRVEVDETTEAGWTLSLRVPVWCGEATLSVSGSPAVKVRPGGYARLRRRWHAGDWVDLDLVMPSRFTQANPLVDSVRGEIALERGPLVYCFEQCDQAAGADLAYVELDEGSPVTESRPGAFLGDAISLHAGGEVQAAGHAPLYSPASRRGSAGRPVDLVAIPYFMWANRRKGPMRVWVPRKEARG